MVVARGRSIVVQYRNVGYPDWQPRTTEQWQPTSGKVLPDKRVFVFSSLRESIDFPRAAFLLLVARSQMLITESNQVKGVSSKGARSARFVKASKKRTSKETQKRRNPPVSCSWFLKYSCLKKKKREGKRERLVAGEISKERVRDECRGDIEEKSGGKKEARREATSLAVRRLVGVLVPFASCISIEAYINYPSCILWPSPVRWSGGGACAVGPKGPKGGTAGAPLLRPVT